MKCLAALVLVPAFAQAQVVYHGTGQGDAVCPLSEAQTEKSIEAFEKIFPVLTQEPRCVNCHGGVNPFIDGIGDPSDPDASRFEHGGGKMNDGMDGGEPTDCSSCHDTLAPKRGGAPSRWQVAGPRIFFIGRDAPTLCAQMHQELASAEEFVGHLVDDNGQHNFVGTAFMGNRGLSKEQYPELLPQRPRISAAGLVNLGKEWIASTGGEFKGNSNRDCGCKPFRYAIRLTTLTEVKAAALQMKSAMAPVEIPITFKDDGSFTGEAEVDFTGQGTVGACSAQYGSRVNIRATGQVVSTPEEQFMRLQLENTAPAVDSVSAQCPRASMNNPDVPGAELPSTVLSFDLDGNVGEYQLYQMPAPANLSSQLRVEIVQLH